MWITGIRGAKVYQIQERPLDPRWSNRDLQIMLSWCSIGQHLGWSDRRAFQAAEAYVMSIKYEGLVWPNSPLAEDMKSLSEFSCPSEITSSQEE